MPLSLFRVEGPPPDALVRAPLMAGVSQRGTSRCLNSGQTASAVTKIFRQIRRKPTYALSNVLSVPLARTRF